MQFCHSKWTVIIKSKVLVIRTSRICQVFFKNFQFGPNIWKSSLPSFTIPYSRGIGSTSSQTFDHPSLLNKVGLSWNFWLWPAVILMPSEIEFCAVSHFKGLINCKNKSAAILLHRKNSFQNTLFYSIQSKTAGY